MCFEILLVNYTAKFYKFPISKDFHIYLNMQKPTITGQIYTKILEILENNPEGIHWSELLTMIKTSYPSFHPKCVWKLVERYPDMVYKPEKGLFRLVKYKYV
ncbi:MAG: hypothetical protein US14_C0043G0003 [candidate division WS6 bacterium GW2011_WS6_36_26]|nr:MAG: hypothetical protein US14_C0043G0003 [candidate division WS6 bacterium GW2011_WS6_36_26]